MLCINQKKAGPAAITHNISHIQIGEFKLIPKKSNSASDGNSV